MKKTYTINDLCEAGLERALDDLCELAHRWQQQKRVNNPGVALLAIEVFTLVFTDEEDITSEMHQSTRKVAKQLLPDLDISHKPAIESRKSKIELS